jgi:phosphate transport system protein
MPRLHYAEKLDDLKKTVVLLGTMVVKSLESSFRALMGGDVELAKRVVREDERIDRIAAQIDDKCALIIAEEQPVARDLRLIVNAVHQGVTIERIGDSAVHVAKTTIRMADKSYTTIPDSIPEMAEISIGMVRDAVDAYVELDPERAREIATRDEKVDHLYTEVFRELGSAIRRDPGSIDQAMSLLFLIRRFERIADQSTHICEGIVFVVTGTREELNP